MQLPLLIIVWTLFSHPAAVATVQPEEYKVYVVQEAWHTGIILTVDDVSADIFPEITNYQKYQYIDVSWGDERYYQYPNPGIFMAARAVLWPTSAVLKLAGYSQNPRNIFTKSTILEITMDEVRFNQLCSFISESFLRDDHGKIIPSTVYRKSRSFFLAKRKYSIFQTCNTWVALAFKESGFDTGTFFLITAGQLFRRLHKTTHSRFIHSISNVHLTMPCSFVFQVFR